MLSNLLPFLAFAFVASVTPGPNNIMVLQAAARGGAWAATPLILGIAAGFGVMVVLVGTGLAGPLASHAALHATLRWLGAGWMLLLAWQIARSGPVDDAAQADGEAPRKAPLGFWGAAAFQWINPKAWVLALATATTYTSAAAPLAPQILTMAAIFIVVCLITLAGWALLGAAIAPWLRSRARMRAFNYGMGLLLALSVIPPLLE